MAFIITPLSGLMVLITRHGQSKRLKGYKTLHPTMKKNQINTGRQLMKEKNFCHLQNQLKLVITLKKGIEL